MKSKYFPDSPDFKIGDVAILDDKYPVEIIWIGEIIIRVSSTECHQWDVVRNRLTPINPSPEDKD